MNCALVLVLEDDPDAREMYHTLLEQHGCDVRSATTGADFRKLLPPPAMPAAIILDIGLSDVSGASLCHELRGETRFANIPILGVTAWSLGPMADSAASAPFTKLLTKPLDPILFLRTLRECIPLNDRRVPSHAGRHQPD